MAQRVGWALSDPDLYLNHSGLAQTKMPHWQDLFYANKHLFFNEL
jgi:hypothetical protein